MLVLYEISTEPRSAFLNALDIINIDNRREVFLSDIVQYIVKQGLEVGWSYAFYVVIQDRLVWLDSLTCLVPPCSDGIIRMVFKPSSLPPFIHLKQQMDFADKSRIQLYSREDYERTSGFATTSFQDAARRAAQAPRVPKARPSVQHADPFAMPSSGAFSNKSTFPHNETPSQFGSSHSSNFFNADFSNYPSEKDSQYEDFAPTAADRRERPQQPLAPQQQRHSESDFREYRDQPPSRYEDEYRDDRYAPPSRYNHDHPKSSNPGNLPPSRRSSATQNNDNNNLHSIVGEDTAAVINDAVEIAAAATKNFFSFASTLGKSVLDLANNASVNVQNASANMINAAPGRLYPGQVVQVGRMVVTVLKELAEGGFGMVYLVEDSNPSTGSRALQYALKQLLCQSREQVTEANSELDALKRFQGRSDGSIIELLEYSTGMESGSERGGVSAAKPRQVLMLFPLYPLGTLWDRVEKGNNSNSWPFPEHVALYVIMCAAESLLVLHREGLAHRDVKPHNFLLEPVSESQQRSRGIPSPIRPVLMDLGSVTAARVQIKNKREALELEEEAAGKTSAAYRSPELTSPPFPPFNVDERVDTWGLGCTMYCLAFGRSPFETPKEGVLRLAILNGRYTTPAGLRNKDCVYSAEYMQLVQKMLNVEITERPYVEEVIRSCQELLSKYN